MDRDKCLAIISSPEDAKIILKPFCKTCAYRKLEIISIYDLTDIEARDMINYGVRPCRIRCECK